MSNKARSYIWAITLMVGIVLSMAACSEDTPTSLPVLFRYEGTYVPLEVSTTRDGQYVSAWNRQAVTGLLEISGNRYLLTLYFGSDAFGYGSRFDSGYVAIDTTTDTITFIQQGEQTQSEPIGQFNIENDWLRVNYLLGDWLWTEIWKRVEPVNQYPDTTYQVPY